MATTLIFGHTVWQDAATFEADFKSPATKAMLPSLAIFGDDPKQFKRAITVPALYYHFAALFNNRFLRFTTTTAFKQAFWVLFAQHYPTLYIQQIAYFNAEFEALATRAGRDAVNYTEPVGSTTAQSTIANTEAGNLASTDPSSFDSSKDKIVQKTFNKSTTTYTNRRTNQVSDDLFMNFIKVTNSTVNFGLEQFIAKFSYLAQEGSSPETEFDFTPPPPINLHIDPDVLYFDAQGRLSVKGMRVV